MPDATQKNKRLFEFYKNIKDGQEVLSTEELEVAIQALEIARENLRIQAQRKLREAEAMNRKQTDGPGKVIRLWEGAKSLSAYAFYENKNITKVVLNEGLTEIGAHAFAGCSHLREVVFPAGSKVRLQRECFSDCVALEKVVIPDVSNIGPKAFYNCRSLETVQLPATISNIYSRAFGNCQSLKEVIFKKARYQGWGTIYSRAFENCTSLESIALPEGMGFYDATTFLNCENLKRIYVHNKWYCRIKLENCPAEIINLGPTRSNA